MAYALLTYLWRSRRIARREPSARYDDTWGPAALTGALVIVSVAAVSFSIAAHELAARGWGCEAIKVRSVRWSPHGRVGVVNADP